MISDSMPASMPNSQQQPTSDNALTNEVSPVLAQQRHIMALMGLDIWVQRDTPTRSVDYEAISKKQSRLPMAQTYRLNNSQQPVADEQPTSDPSASSGWNQGPSSTQPSLNPTVESNQSANGLSSLQDQQPTVEQREAQPESNLHQTREKLRHNPIATLKEKIIPDAQAQEAAAEKKKTKIELVDAFDILGVHYQNWVLLVNAKALSESDAAVSQLWGSLLNALSLKPQHQKFPICEGIMDKESANASVAGFIFCLAKTDKVKVAALTDLPKGIEVDQIVSTPSLTDMLADSRQKKVLWQLLNGN